MIGFDKSGHSYMYYLGYFMNKKIQECPTLKSKRFLSHNFKNRVVLLLTLKPILISLPVKSQTSLIG